MSESNNGGSTDRAWEEWGRRDPYFGVITNPKFRRGELTPERKREFFASGPLHVDWVLAVIRQHIAPDFSPKRVLDFGCGVGRLVVPFARIADEVVGLDVSPSMLQEARVNCESSEVSNVKLLVSDDTLSRVEGQFDLVHSCIVFQHIPVDRGRAIFSRLLRLLRPGGVAALQLTYSKAIYADTHGIAPPASPSSATTLPPPRPGADPEIQMNPYHLNQILFAMQSHGVQRFYTEFSDHGGELGVFLFFSVTGPGI